MPSIVDRSPLVIAVSTGGASPILGRMLKARLETLIPSAYGRLAELVSGFRGELAAAIPSQTMRRRFWEAALEGPIAEAALAGDEEAAKAHLSAEIERWAEAKPSPRGEVYLVGAGPGDPDLVTFRALRLMQKADVVLYDRLADARIMTLVRREAERIYVGKRPDNHELPQEEISALLVSLAQEGKRVLRLKGGDPFVFGRGGEEIETLAEHGVPFQVCPGVTAAIGASAYAGIPLTHRDHAQACVFVTGHGKDGRIDLDWTALIKPHQTVAIYMGLRNLEPLTEAFLAHGASPDLPAAVVDNATRPNQRVAVGNPRHPRRDGPRSRPQGPFDRHPRDRRHSARQARLVRAGDAGAVRASLSDREGRVRPRRSAGAPGGGHENNPPRDPATAPTMVRAAAASRTRWTTKRRRIRPSGSRDASASRRRWAKGSITKTATMNSAQTRTIASIHQNEGSEKRGQSSSRQVIQRPVAPASGIVQRTWAENRFSINSNSAQPFRASAPARASGSATRVTNETPPIQWATNRTCRARASSTSSTTMNSFRHAPSVAPECRTGPSLPRPRMQESDRPGKVPPRLNLSSTPQPTAA